MLFFGTLVILIAALISQRIDSSRRGGFKARDARSVTPHPLTPSPTQAGRGGTQRFFVPRPVYVGEGRLAPASRVRGNERQRTSLVGGKSRRYTMPILWLLLILAGGLTLASKHSGIVFVVGALGWIFITAPASPRLARSRR